MLTGLLRSRLAQFALLAVFVFPLGTASLRGLTHILTCDERIETPFTVAVPESGGPTVTTSLRVNRDSDDSICESITINLGARLTADGLALVVPVSNLSDAGWRGTIRLSVAGETIPVDIGAVGPDDTSTQTIPLHLPDGTHELSGTLLIGP